MTIDRDAVIARGHRAEALLQDPLLSGALSTMREQVRNLFFDLAPEDTERQQKLVMLDRMRQQFENILVLMVNDMKVEQSELLAEHQTQTRVEALRSKARGY